MDSELDISGLHFRMGFARNRKLTELAINSGKTVTFGSDIGRFELLNIQ